MRKTRFQPALILPVAASTWGSCQTIMPNLEAAYRKAFEPNLQTFSYGIGQSDVEAMQTAQKIAAASPSHLVFIDHERHPLDLLLALDLVYRNKTWPQLVFHVYGDFSLYTPHWYACEELLKGRRALFVCASPRQQKFISNFIKAGRKHTAVCPFPVAESDFHFAPGVREKARAELGLMPDEFAIVYTGRLSTQKNILRLVWDISRACDDANISFQLILAGAFDDLGSHFFGLHHEPYSYFHAYQSSLHQLPEHLRARVKHIGSLGKSELKNLYHAGDLFTSFSTHHDEDYGMSPIEALCCGTPALISDWGGFAGFAVDPNSVALIPVAIGPQGPMISARGLKRDLLRFQKLKNSSTDAERAARARFFSDRFGVRPASQILDEMLRTHEPVSFEAMTPRLRKHAQLHDEMESKGYMFKTGRQTDENYLQFYRHYCAKD